MVSDLAATPGAAPSLQDQGITPVQPRHVQVPAPLSHKRATASVNSPGMVTIRRLITETSTLLPASIAPTRELWNLPPLVSAGQPFAGSSRRQVVAGKELSTLGGRRWEIADTGNLQPGLDKSMQLAPTHFRSEKQESPEPKSDPTSSWNEAGASETISQQPPFAFAEQPSSTLGAATQDQSPSSDRGGTAGGDGSQRTRPAVSTLHIDGAALGRWTVQHLERALAKPPAGMTGVDPRASLPRSRVAPF